MFKVGDKVVCVEAIKGITYGKVYTVLDGDEWGDTSAIEIVDDEDDKAWYYAPRFTSAIITNLDPLVTIHQSEYDNLIDEINMLQELVAELSKTNVNLAMEYSEQFKPISEYTLADWELACKEGWEFECRDGKNVRIVYTYSEGDDVLRGDDDLTRTVTGHWIVGETDSDDIVKRIK